MNWIVLHAGLAFFALSIVGILWCSGAVTTYTTTNKKTRITTTHNTTCPNDETAAIATASLAVVDCVAITVCSIVGLVLYHLYFRSYDIKARGEYQQLTNFLFGFSFSHWRLTNFILDPSLIQEMVGSRLEVQIHDHALSVW